MVEFLQSYSFVLKHINGKSTKVADVLSRIVMLLNTMSIEVVSLDNMKGMSVNDVDFTEAWSPCKDLWSTYRSLYLDFHIQDGSYLRIKTYV